MAYLINRYDGTELVVLEDGTLDTTTSIGLLGRNYTGYGEVQNENFLHLLENFANGEPPTRPLSGQVWYDTSNKTLNVYDGNVWAPVGSAAFSTTEPEGYDGSLWYKTTTDQLYVYDTGVWKLIGPEAVEGFGPTKIRSRQIFDTTGIGHAILEIIADDLTIAIASADSFTPGEINLLPGFPTITGGFNVTNYRSFIGNVVGNASSAGKLEPGRNINGVFFNGENNITIKASTTANLTAGEYLNGSNFDGSSATTWSVDATPSNLIGTVVARDSAGDFSAGTITADLVGNVQGDVVSAGTSTFNTVVAAEFIGATLTGNAFTATKLATPRNINGVAFDGSQNITVPAASNTLTGTSLASNVVSSALTTLGTLSYINLSDGGSINVGNPGGTAPLKIYLDSTTPTIRSTTGTLNLDLGSSGPDISFINAATALLQGAENTATLVPSGTAVNLGTASSGFNKVYAASYYGTDLRAGSLYPSTGGSTITANGNFVVTGNFTVQGTTTTVSSTEVEIVDKTLTLAYGSANSSSANGAGIFVAGANASFVYASSGDKWVANKDIDVGASSFIGTATSARYADLAEKYLSDAEYEAGTVLEFGGDHEVTLAEDESRRVAGVVSSNPAYLMNSELQGKHVVAIALQGRVPCKVRGTIRKGDMLVSGGDGYARPATDPKIGTIIGKSLEDFDGISGTIEVVVGRI